jgi:hypothetical protein
VTAEEAFDVLIAAHLWPRLREHDFRRTRYSFHRSAGRNWQVINFQKSAYSDRASVSFTVNVAVGLDLLRDGLRDWTAGKRPAESSCHLRERLGVLLVGEDTWWDVAPRSDLAALGDALVTAIEDAALPWLIERSDEDRLLALARDPVRLASEGWLTRTVLVALAEAQGESALAASIRPPSRRAPD